MIRIAKSIRSRVYRYYKKTWPRSTILLYHRVTDHKPDPLLLSVSIQNFDRQMSYLRRHYKVLQLAELAQYVKAHKNPPSKSVVVTFDDGYHDNFRNAIPILKKYNIPATFFVCTPDLEHPFFWWDVLEQVLLAERSLIPFIEIMQKEFSGILPETLQADGLDTLNSARDWNVKCAKDPNLGCRIYRALWQHLEKSDPQAWFDMKAYIAQSYDVGVSPEKRLMNSMELKELIHFPLFEVGGHTCHHPPLSALDIDHQNQEIQSNKQNLESILGRKLISFAFPFGKRTSVMSIII